MTHLFRFVVLGWFCCAGLPAFAQNRVGYGDWKLHLPANRPLALADAGDRLYVITEASFFYLDKKLKTTQLLSRRDGLHDVGVAAVTYDSVSQQTVVAYHNGNLDVIRKDGAVRNIPDVVRKNIQGSKNVYQVVADAKSAYVATSFGLLNFDLEKLEVRDTYSNIGTGGKAVEIYAVATLHDTLYAATTDGILSGALRDNLLDYRNWTRETNLPQFRGLAVQNGYVYASANQADLYRLSGVGTERKWRPIPNTYAALWRRIRPSKSGLLTLDDQGGLRQLGKNTDVFSTLISPAAAGMGLDVVRQPDGSYLLASYNNGLSQIMAGGQVLERFVPNAPASSLNFNLVPDARTNTVTVLSGGFTDRYLQYGFRVGFYEYQNGQWTSYNAQNLPTEAAYPNLLDLARGTRTPDGKLYVASYGNGLLEWEGPSKFRQFTQGTPASPLLSALANNPNFTRVTDVAADAEGDVWVVNRHGRPGISGLFILKPSTTAWETIPYFLNSNNLDRIVIDDNNVAWVSESRKEGSGLWAVDRTGTKQRHLTTANELPSNEINDLVKDRRGFIWVATSKGVASFNDPTQVFEASSDLKFQAPNVLRGEGRNYPALWTEPVRCAAIDGGNRKWFGTDNGLWLFNEDVNEALLHFTTVNSPLPSNRIVDVAVNDVTGEVFVATDAGLVSYRGAATVTEGAPKCVQAFPNPVRPGFVGQVGINGLANNALVKITDVAGKLVFSTRANGGTVVWDLNDANGRRVRSGVYLVLSSDSDGKNGCVSKVAVL